jgi:hypothetical protein
MMTAMRLYDEVLAKTEKCEVKWRRLAKSANAELIFHAERVSEQYELQWQAGSLACTLLLIEKRHEEIEHPLLAPSEIKKYELLMVENGELVRKLDEWALNWSQLCRLAWAVRHNSSTCGEPVSTPA